MEHTNSSVEQDSKELERLEKRYSELFKDSGDIMLLSNRLADMQSDPDIDKLRSVYINHLLYAFCAGYAKYPSKDTDEALHVKQLFCKNAALLPKHEENSYYFAVSSFFQHQKNDCIRYLKQYLSSIRNSFTDGPMNEAEWSDFLLDTFKNAYPGFWIEVSGLLKQYPCDPEVVEQCRVVEAYYRCNTDDEVIDLLLPFAGAHPNLSLPKELLGFSFQEKRMWNNALACFEQVEGKSVLFYASDIYFQMAWCFGKLRHYSKEETYYKKCLEADETYPNALNNLGYCLYKKKAYEAAYSVFEQCLNEERDLPFAANNYVRLLLAQGKYQTAHEFVAKKRFKVSSDLLRRLCQHPAVDTPTPSVEATQPEEDNEADGNSSDFGIKRQQFSSEKVLEDELSARIEMGFEVFGHKLKIYKRSGDFYGRQYPIAHGKWRLDLLCEDVDDNLFVIELKKDSGYDDPYEQTKQYVNWLKKHKCKKGKRVHGIICMSAPSNALIEKVRRDEEISLYEYQISYREIK